ncbi:GAF domain-containing protein [Ktedonosporobacter rubrisoli]|uniref:GAF domain-containing protein n=1 Tax=Ktedonosporobacter rubrisoli TaxID=2509675 RepID=UPI0013EEAA9F|nr:GAF domain-containing protein [Ktedonosporobacter rubrisoli]
MKKPAETYKRTKEVKTHASALEESAIVERVARIVSSVRGSKPDYTRLAAELAQAIPFDIFGVVLLRHDRQAVRVTVCSYGQDGTWEASYHQHPCEGSMLELILQSPILLVNDYPEGLDGPPAVSGDALSSYHQLHSTLIAPLIVEDRVLGTLELGSTRLHTYADATLQRLITAVVRVLATAIEGAQVGGSVAIQDRQRQALKDVSSALTSKIDLPTIFHQIVSGVTNALDVASMIVMLDRKSGKLLLEAQSGLGQEVLGRLFSRGIYISNKCIISQTLQQRHSYVSQDIISDERFSDSYTLFSQLGMRSILSYPLMTDTTVYGALLLCSPEPGGFTPLKADILALFASQATVAIHNGVLLESAHQRRRFQTAIEQLERARTQNTADLLQLSQHENGEEDNQGQPQDEYQLLERVRQEAQNTFGVSFTSLLSFISDHLLTRGERDLQAILRPYQGEQSEEDISGALKVEQQETTAELETGQALTVHNNRKDPLAETLSLLTQTAEAALIRADILGR